MLSLTTYQNPEVAIIKLLKRLSIKIDPAVVIAELEKHPDYPSLLAISDVLSAFNIDNAAYRVNIAGLGNLPCPFIAHTNINNGDFLVVSKIDDKNVIVSGGKWNNHKLAAEEFQKIFKGVALVADPPDRPAVKAAFAASLTSVKMPAIMIGLALMVAIALLHNGFFATLTWQVALLSVFKTAGVVIAILLLIQSIDSNNPLIQKLCNGTGKTNCNAILSSKAANVFDGLTWSEVGFFYFAGTWLLLLFGGGSPETWWALAILNVISLPYTIYSVYYQARVAKQWCVLCCTVQGLLWLEFIAIIFNPLSFNYGSVANIIPAGQVILVCLLVPVLLWLLAKPLFLKQQQLGPLKQQLRKFKYNTDLFTNMLDTQPKYTQPDNDWSITLGNVEANSIITMVSNPYCQPCAKMHKALDELLTQNGNLQARIIFSTNNANGDLKTQVVRHMMALNEQPDKTIVKKALHDWYDQKQKDYQAWAAVYPVQLSEANFYKLEKQKAWVEMAEVATTPTMLLNGYRLPEIYQLPDLKYMLG